MAPDFFFHSFATTSDWKLSQQPRGPSVQPWGLENPRWFVLSVWSDQHFPAAAGSGNCPAVICSSDRFQPALIRETGNWLEYVRGNFCSCCQCGVGPCSWTSLHLNTVVLLVNLQLCFPLRRWNSYGASKIPGRVNHGWKGQSKKSNFLVRAVIPPIPCAGIILSFASSNTLFVYLFIYIFLSNLLYWGLREKQNTRQV